MRPGSHAPWVYVHFLHNLVDRPRIYVHYLHIHKPEGTHDHHHPLGTRSQQSARG